MSGAILNNRDILTGSIAAVMAITISYLTSIAQWAMIFGGFLGSDDDSDNLSSTHPSVTEKIRRLST